MTYKPTVEETIEQDLARLKGSLLPSFDIGDLHARNPIAHKWKAPFRCLLLREAVFWRLQDLLTQSFALHRLGHALGARILVRSALESLALLIYMNQLTESVIDGKLNFHVFADKTATLLLGSKNGSTAHVSLNIMTILEKCAKRYDLISKIYADLSECAHPNFEGICLGYARHDDENLVESFSNRWAELYSGTHLDAIKLCIDVFEYEYNHEWPEHFAALEKWIEANDAELEATKNTAAG